ncbi:hypothetical protein [Pelosinus sp. IPA-1]|uniref:hypothetical protein n=1 Tax=Pelosinus sp. IPA-1 TaxID=3029569 RepID=UPI00243620B3|nr:hypothetical protein [Pelosinus sp. IPA-1]GMB01855.1 hypothetical protein PIPA1_46550 [Pelosinus sp. IPA-1]
MSLKSRLQKIESKILSNNGENIIWVKIVEDDGSFSNCSHRRDDCPEYPCKTDSCWMERKYPDMKTIEISNESEGV